MAKAHFDFKIVESIFTDREKAQSLFWEKYHYIEKHKEEYFVVSYYGIGGIGKTSLVTQICHELNQKDLLYIKYDFASNPINDKKNILLGICKILRSKYCNRFDFPLFYSALLVLAKKSGDNIFVDQELHSILEDHEWMEVLLDDIGLIPIVGTVAQIIKAFDSTTSIVRQVFQTQKNINEYNYLLTKINGMESNEILDNLHYYFCIDMKKNMEKMDQPLVVILDTYEHYINTFKKGGSTIDDAWLRSKQNSVIQSIPGIVWVISGREALNWNKTQEQYGEFESFLLESFPKKETEQYLQKNGIYDETLENQIFSLTKGMPLFLEICVERYRALIDNNEEVTIEKLGQNMDELLERYLRYMDSASLDMLQILSCFGRWTNEEIYNIGPKIKSIRTFSRNRYNQFLDHSMIINNNGVYYLHDTIQMAVLSLVDDSTKEEIYSLIIDYITAKMIDNVENSDGEKNLLDVLDYVSKKGDYTYLFKQYVYIKRIIVRIADAGNYELLDSIIEKISEICADQFSVSTELLKVANYFIAYCIERMGSAIKAIKYLEDIDTEGKQNNDISEIVLLDSKLLFAECLQKIGEYSIAKEKCNDIIALSCKILGEENDYYLKTMRLLGSVLLFMDKCSHALYVSKKVFQIDHRKYGLKDITTNQSRILYARCLNANKYYNKAIKNYKYAISVYEDTIGIYHRETGRCYNNLGYTYYNAERYDEALETLNKALEIRIQVLPDGHPAVARTYNNIGMVYNAKNQYDKAWKYCLMAYEKRKNIYLETHPEIANSFHCLGIISANQQQYSSAIQYLKQAYSIRLDKLGSMHKDTKDSATKLDEVYRLYNGETK